MSTPIPSSILHTIPTRLLSGFTQYVEEHEKFHGLLTSQAADLASLNKMLGKGFPFEPHEYLKDFDALPRAAKTFLEQHVFIKIWEDFQGIRNPAVLHLVSSYMKDKKDTDTISWGGLFHELFFAYSQDSGRAKEFLHQHLGDKDTGWHLNGIFHNDNNQWFSEVFDSLHTYLEKNQLLTKTTCMALMSCHFNNLEYLQLNINSWKKAIDTYLPIFLELSKDEQPTEKEAKFIKEFFLNVMCEREDEIFFNQEMFEHLQALYAKIQPIEAVAKSFPLALLALNYEVWLHSSSPTLNVFHDSSSRPHKEIYKDNVEKSLQNALEHFPPGELHEYIQCMEIDLTPWPAIEDFLKLNSQVPVKQSRDHHKRHKL